MAEDSSKPECVCEAESELEYVIGYLCSEEQ